MHAWNAIIGFAGTILILAAALLTYYTISYAVLFAVGKLLPLAGRRSSRRSRRT